MNQDKTEKEKQSSEDRAKMGSYAGSTPTTRLRPNPKHFLTWSAAVANNRIQKLGKNFVNNVSRLHSKMERVMPTFQSQSTSGPPHNCNNDQVENDLSEPNKAHHFHKPTQDTFGISRVQKIPLSASQSNCEKNELKTGSYLNNSEALNCSGSGVSVDADANEERYTGCTPSSHSYRAKGQEILAVVENINTACGSSANSIGYAGGSSVKNSSGYLGASLEPSNRITSGPTGPGFPHQVQVQSARIVQSQPFKQEVSSAASVVSPKSLVQSGHYKIPANPTITAEALKAMIINSPTELNSCRKFEDKPQPIKYVDVEVETATISDVNNMLEMRTLSHENQSKYNLSCGSSNSNNASMSDSSSIISPLRVTAHQTNTPSQWNQSSFSAMTSSPNTKNTQLPPIPILKGILTNAENDYDKRNNMQNKADRHPSSYNGNMSSANLDEINSYGIDNEGHTATDQKPSVSFSSPVIESSDKASLLLTGKKSFAKKGKSNKSSQGGMKNNGDKRSVVFQNPLSGTTSVSNRKHSPAVSPEAYPQSQLTVTIFEEEAELRHASWFQAGIPRDIALEVLRNEPIGSFIVRESTTKAGCFALSLRVPKEFKRLGIAHYLILKSGRGYKIKGFTKEFKSLNSLITHHSVMPELLPCPLSLHRYRTNYPQKISRFNSSDFMEPEKLVGFTNFVDCLEAN